MSTSSVSDYQAGQQAAAMGYPYDMSQPKGWRNGWEDYQDERAVQQNRDAQELEQWTAASKQLGWG